MKNFLYGSAAMSLAFSLSLRRYLPFYFESFKISHIPFDLTILTFSLMFGATYGATSVDQQVH
jgi:hypothetical protein